MNSLDQMKKLIECCGDATPQLDHTSDSDVQINYSKTHTMGDASVTVSATASSTQDLEAVLRLAGMDPTLAQMHMPEPEVPQEPEPESPMSFGTRGDYSYSTDAEFIRDQLRQRIQDYL